MYATHAAIGIPARIRMLQRFGVGRFGRVQREEKCACIREVMRTRAPLRQDPLLSVIIPVHKESQYLLATLRSLAEQRCQDAEFIIVSNGEPKGNPSQRLAEECGFTVLHERAAGGGRARQCGLLAARGSIIVTTDADTLHASDWLDAIAADCEADTSFVGAYGWVHALSPSSLYQLCNRLQNMSRTVQGKSLLFGISEANSWFRREAALAIGGYDIASTYAEGVVLLRKLGMLGEVRCSQDPRTAVYTSDRRPLADRFWAGTQYLMSFDSQRVRYSVIR